MRALAFSADGRTLATTAGDGRVLVWDLRSGEVRETLTGHTGAINTLRFSDDGHTLYTAGLDGRIIVWDIAGDRRLARPFRAGGQNCRLSAAARDQSVRPDGCRRAPRRRRAPARRAHPAPPPRPAGDRGRTRGRCRVQPRRSIDRRDGRGRHGGATRRSHRPPRAPAAARLGAPAQAMAFSPDGGRLAVADIDGNLRLLDLGSGKVRRASAAGRLSDSPVLQPRWRDARDRARRRRHRAARRSVSPARRPPAPARRRRRLVGSLLAGWPAAGRHLPALHAAVGRGQAPANRPAAEGPRRCGVHLGVLARRPDARDERIRRQRDPLGRRVAPLAWKAPRASRPDIGPLYP